MSKLIKNFITEVCDMCQTNKTRGQKKYVKIPFAKKMQDVDFWECVHVDTIGPWKVKFRLAEEGKVVHVHLHALAMVDRATTWPEFALCPDKSSFTNAHFFYTQ